MIIPAGSARSGVLSFAGRIHPDATSLSVGLNAGVGHSSAGQRIIYPSLAVEAIPLTGDALVAPLPLPAEAGGLADHPNGVRLQLATITFSDDGSSAELVIDNIGDEAVALAARPTHSSTTWKIAIRSSPQPTTLN